MAQRPVPHVEQRAAVQFQRAAGQVAVHALSSGSSGNSTLVQADGINLLIDAGMPIRALTAALRSRGVGTSGLQAILLTHEHTDHVVSAVSLARRTGATIFATSGTFSGLADREPVDAETRILRAGEVIGVGPFGIRAFPVPHDAREAVGYVIETSTVRIAYCTDVGSVTPDVRAALDRVQLAIIEANHDLDMLWRGPYTPTMKERVASSSGHLSNTECAQLLAERVEAHGPMTAWLAHLSRVNNSPALALRTVSSRISSRTRVPIALHVALRDQPSVHWVSGQQAVQLSLL